MASPRPWQRPNPSLVFGIQPVLRIASIKIGIALIMPLIVVPVLLLRPLAPVPLALGGCRWAATVVAIRVIGISVRVVQLVSWMPTVSWMAGVHG